MMKVTLLALYKSHPHHLSNTKQERANESTRKRRYPVSADARGMEKGDEDVVNGIFMSYHPLQDQKEYEKQISALLLQQPVDLQRLRSMSRWRGGYQNNQLRSRVWCKLFNINRYNLQDIYKYRSKHRDHDQICRDVERSLWSYYPTDQWSDKYRERRRKALYQVIINILNKNTNLFYYQGFHDFVSVFLLVVENDLLALALAEAASRIYMLDYMQENFEVFSKVMRMIFTIVKVADPALYSHLEAANLQPFFATSWFITLFSHDLKSLEDIARLFDAFFASPPIYIFYFCATYVISLRHELLAAEPEFSMLHSILVKAPQNIDFDVEKLIKDADNLLARISFAQLMSSCEHSVFQLLSSQR